MPRGATFADVEQQDFDICAYFTSHNALLQLGRTPAYDTLPPPSQWPTRPRHATSALLEQLLADEQADDIYIVETIHLITEVDPEFAGVVRTALRRVKAGVDVALIINGVTGERAEHPGNVGHWITMILKPGLHPTICGSALLDSDTHQPKPAHLRLYAQAARHVTALLDSMTSEPLYCSCRTFWEPDDETAEELVGCDECYEWFHLTCEGRQDQALPESYICNSCSPRLSV
jgi:hypothetical protein